MPIESIEWTFALMIVSFVLGAMIGRSVLRWLLRIPQAFLKPSYLQLVGYLKSDKGKSKIYPKP